MWAFPALHVCNTAFTNITALCLPWHIKYLPLISILYKPSSGQLVFDQKLMYYFTWGFWFRNFEELQCDKLLYCNQGDNDNQPHAEWKLKFCSAVWLVSIWLIFALWLNFQNKISFSFVWKYFILRLHSFGISVQIHYIFFLIKEKWNDEWMKWWQLVILIDIRISTPLEFMVHVAPSLLLIIINNIIDKVNSKFNWSIFPGCNKPFSQFSIPWKRKKTWQ